MLKAARIFALGGFLLVAACFEIDLTGLNALCIAEWCPHTPRPFTLTPDSTSILRGDTVTYYTWACPDYFCQTEGNVNSRWSIEGDAAAVGTAPGALTKSVASATRILVHGVTAGRAMIKAIDNGDSTHIRTAWVYVADSSVITQVRLRIFTGMDTLRMGYRLAVYADLIDSAGTVYRTQPDSWSVSDSSIAQLAIGRMEGGRGLRIVEPKTTGTVEVTTTFNQLTATLRVTVVP